MKFLIIIAFFGILPTTAFNQYTSIDTKYGFNRFKLESSYELEKSNLEFIFQGKTDGVKYYKYKKSDVNDVFGEKFRELNLGYYKNQLYTINIDFGYLPKESESMIMVKMAEIFGRPHILGTKTPYDNGYLWTGDKSVMQLGRYSNEYLKDPLGVELFMISKILDSKIKQDSF